MYDLLIILPNKYLCDHLTDSTTQFLVPQVCCYALCPAHITSQPSPYIQKSVGKLWLSLFWVTCTLRAEVPWLAAASECAQLRTPRRSPLLPPLHPLQFCFQLTPPHSSSNLPMLTSPPQTCFSKATSCLLQSPIGLAHPLLLPDPASQHGLPTGHNCTNSRSWHLGEAACPPAPVRGRSLISAPGH